MALTHNQFKVINALSQTAGLTQREIAETTGMALATVNVAMKECAEEGLLEDGRLTAKGMAALKPYAVDNAVILAAGLPAASPPSRTNAPRACSKCAATCSSSAKSNSSRPPA